MLVYTCFGVLVFESYEEMNSDKKIIFDDNYKIYSI